MFLISLAILSLVSVTEASWGWGPCKRTEIMSDISLDEYYGTWYEIVRDTTFKIEDGSSCVFANYTPIEGKDYFQVMNAGIQEDGDWNTAIGEAKAKKDGGLNVRFSRFQPWGNYNIIDTDYKSYALVHSCVDFLLFHHDINWILARKRNYEPTQEQINTMVELGTKEKDLHYTVQTNCPKYDE